MHEYENVDGDVVTALEALADEPDPDGGIVIMLSDGYAEVFGDGDVVQFGEVIFNAFEEQESPSW